MSDYTQTQNYLELAAQSSDRRFKDRALMKAAEEIETLKASQVKTDNSKTLANALEENERLRGQNEKLTAALKEKMIFGEGAYVLRKQAEAVEDCANYFGGRDFVDVRFIIDEHAQRLRQQASDLEAGGGDDPR